MFELGVTEAGCLAHARRKFHELWDPHKSPLAEQALKFFAVLYDIEREAQALDPGDRRRVRQERARPIAEDFHVWLQAQRARVPDGSAIAKAIDYSLGRWAALTRYLDDGKGNTIIGMVAKINRRTASVATDDGRSWRVDFTLLRHLVDV